MLAAGKLNRRITLQQPSETQGGILGDPQRSWTDVATVWAAIEPLSGREFFANQETHGELSARIRVRHRRDVTEKWRVVYGARIFEIKSPPIAPLDSPTELHLMCSELKSG